MTTKRTMGQCTGNGCEPRRPSGPWHTYSCPALYPLQPQPGDAKDALTRLTAYLRGGRLSSEDVDAALALISEAREEHRHQRDVSRHAAQVACDELDKVRSAFAVAEHDLARHMDILRTCQAKMGEVRQTALDEGRAQGHVDATLWLRAHHKGVLKPTAEDMRVDLAEMMRDVGAPS